MTIAAWIYVAATGLVVVFHLAVILGAPVGHLTMGGRWRGALPPVGRLAAALSASLLTGLALVVLARAGVIGLDLPGWSIWAVVGVTALSVLAHIATPSAAERALWLPVILVMLASVLVVALGDQLPAP